MSNPTPPLPFTLLPNWKQMYDQVETFWTKPLNEVIRSETYLTLTGLMREQTLTRHESAKEIMEAYWEALRLPTKSDHARLAGQVVALETKVENLADKLDEAHKLLGEATAKLDAVLSKLDANAKNNGANPNKKSPVEA